MGEADLARAHLQPAAGERGHAGRMVRRAERAGAADPPRFEHSRDRLHHGHLERLGRGEVRQDAGQAAGEQALARTGRADHQQIVSACRGDLERALGGLLPLDLFEIIAPRRLGHAAARRLGEDEAALEVPQEAHQIARGEHRHAAGPACLGALLGRADQACALRAGVERGDQHPGARDHPSVERQLADRDPVAQLLGIGHAHGGQQSQRDRQVVMRSVLGQIGGGEVDGDALGREREAHRGQRRLHPLAALAHRLVGQADDIETRQAGADVALHLHGACLQPEIGNGSCQRDHLLAPLTPDNSRLKGDSAGLRDTCRAPWDGR